MSSALRLRILPIVIAFFTAAGSLITYAGWQNQGSFWYYTDNQGAQARGTWINSSGTWYYFNQSDARMASNCVTPDGYSLDINGAWTGQSAWSGTFVTLQDRQQEQEILDLVNRERAGAGLPALMMDDTLQQYAELRSWEMSQTGILSHTRPNGTQGTDYLMSSLGCMCAGENAAYSVGKISTASEVMNQWMNSQGHRENILGSGYTSVGIGMVRSGNAAYFIQVFAGH